MHRLRFSYGRAAIAAYLFALLFILSTLVPASSRLNLPELTKEQRTAIKLLRETVSQIEENYVSLPNMNKVFGAGLTGIQKSIGKKHLEVIRMDSGRYTLRAGGEEMVVRFGAGGSEGLAAMERAYRFALSKVGSERSSGSDLKVMYDSLGAIFNSLDAFSAFLPPDVYREMQVETTGRYGGLGITITTRDKKITIVSPIEDTPAFEVGLQPGDVIALVNGESTKGWSLSKAVKKMRGPPGTAVRLGITRQAWISPKEFVVVRAVVQIRSVKSRIMAEDIGYVRLTAFHERTSDELGTALRRFRNSGVRAIVLDLRNNPGGLLRQSVRVAERFLPERSMVVFTRGRHRSQTMYFRTHGHGAWFDKPIIVLVNKGSASASEIVAGALKDLDRGLLIGRKTFGKGSVQTIIPLSGGAGIRITTAKYYTPLGVEIHGIGIQPDIEVGPAPKPKKENRAKSSTKSKSPQIPKRIDDPSFGDDDEVLQLAIKTLKKTKSSVVEVLRLTARQIQPHIARHAKGNSHAKVPKAQNRNP
ncbi:MAG: S41 family peptidase [Nitrospinaceae bacterium]|jgi:carboxyl-terminal processing protease|nr:S41 family peptidase [Nitrospinaceae bacterium]MBT4431251.1 S41 family peptidase [Nitrospinaceae bacterium]MBT7857285.1 S41 family peptidase [Nitrospinaceae bacterium]